MEDPNSVAPEIRTYLTPEAIEAVDDTQMEDHFVPEWNGWITIRGLSGSARDAWEESMTKRVGKGKNEKMVRVFTNIRAKLLILTIWNREKNAPLFPNTHENIKMLGNKAGSVLSDAFDIACRLSGIGDDAIEEMEGNSIAEGGDGSLGESPSE